MLTLTRFARGNGAKVVAGEMRKRTVTTVSLPELPYEYGALEPVISGQIMELHHAKHHQAYVTGYNTAVGKLEEALAKNDASSVVSLQGLLKFNGGGHINHSIFWQNLAPQKEGGGAPPEGALASAIDAQFGSLDELIKQMNTAGAGVQGSGWVWLGHNKNVAKDMSSANQLTSLVVQTTANQDPLFPTTGLVPLLGIDVWEHAYYLQYKNVRPDYLKAVWSVVNWKDVSSRFESATI